MANILHLPRHYKVPSLPDNFDDGNWDELPEVSDEFAPALMIVLEQYDIDMDPTLSKDKDMANRDIGVLSASWGIVDDSRKKWSIHLNWQVKWARKLPPHHMMVEYDGQEVGCLSPFMFMRCCSFCGLGTPIVNGEYSDDGYYRPKLRAPNGARIPWVLPGHPCPKCGQYDWWGSDPGEGKIQTSVARREDFQRSAGEHFERLTGQEGSADKFSVIHGDGQQQRFITA